jgi:hypothetical protein
MNNSTSNTTTTTTSASAKDEQKKLEEQLDKEYDREVKENKIDAIISEIDQFVEEEEGLFLDPYQARKLKKIKALLRYERIKMDIEALNIDVDFEGANDET